MSNLPKWQSRSEAEGTFPRNYWKELPFIEIPQGWLMQPIYPFGGAYCRFRLKSPKGKEYSIYFDLDDSLGVMEKPYWEVYPINGDCERFWQDETKEMIERIMKDDEK
jgi:hypothetical protein